MLFNFYGLPIMMGLPRLPVWALATWHRALERANILVQMSNSGIIMGNRARARPRSFLGYCEINGRQQGAE